MMTTHAGELRSISWPDLCPWTLLFRIFRLAISLQPLALALLGALASSAGWTLLDQALLTESSRNSAEMQEFQQAVVPWSDVDSLTARIVGSVATGDATSSSHQRAPIAEVTRAEGLKAVEELQAIPPHTPGPGGLIASSPSTDGSLNPLAHAWRHGLRFTPAYGIVEPFRRAMVPRSQWDQRLYFLFGGWWNLLIWCWFGGAITRIASVRLGRDERVGFREALGFAHRKLPSFLGAPFLPWAAILALSLPLIVLGLLMRFDFGVAFAGLVWIPIAIIGFIMSLFAIGLTFGWPLMWATISTEGSDAFDAISRSYAYTYQRPLQYLFYACLSTFLGFLGWILVALFCDSIVRFTHWGAAMGAGGARIDTLRAIVQGDVEATNGMLWFGTLLIAFTHRLVRAFLTAYAYSYLWVAASAIYLLLRRDADQTEIDDVYLEEDDQVTYGLPSLPPDESGVPGVDPQENGSGDSASQSRQTPE